MRWVSSASLLALMLSSSCAAQTGAQKVAVSEPSRPAPELTRASALRMTTAQLARSLLPGQAPGRFVSHEVGKLGPHGEPLGIIHFFHRPVAIGPDLCRRQVTNAYFQPDGAWQPGKDTSVRFTRSGPAVQIAVAPRCRLKVGGYFGWVQPEGAIELAPQALRRLAELQDVARAGGQLPIKVTCQTEGDAAACARPPHTLIASLPLDRIYIIRPDRSGWEFSVMPNGPGQPHWKVRIPPEGAIDEPLVMRWGPPAPF